MPTERQKLAAEISAENGGNISRAMLEAGYSPQTAKTPQKLTQSKGFIQILEEAGVTDERLTQVMNEGLGATRAVVMGTKSEESFVDIQPDYAIRHKYLETAIKVKGHITPVDTPSGNTYNTFIQQNNLNPNTPAAKEIVDSTLEMLMKQTSSHGE